MSPPPPEDPPRLPDYREYRLRPLLVDAATAHAERYIHYEDDGTVVCRHPHLSGYGRTELRFPVARQFPIIRATFDDLNKALSRLSNSPLVEGARSLREAYEAEAAHYDELAAAAYAEGRWEPDYGTYVVDHARGDLYLVAPVQWHRLALVTSNAMLLTDPEVMLSWQAVRKRLQGAVIGFAGVSVGGNICEGWLREARPARVKVADPDWLELTNFNRGERMSLRHAVGSRGERFDPRNPYESARVSKAEYLAYEQQLVDPYTTFYVYSEGLTRQNVDQFLGGDQAEEPPLDVLVEEMDNLELKVVVREKCRARGIDVLMLSDFGHRVHVLWNLFRADPEARIGYDTEDDTLRAVLDAAKAGDRNKMFEFIACLCGRDFAGDQFQAWMEGKGEQPTSSLPQSGATAMASGAIGGKELALHVLGHRRSSSRVIYDLLTRNVIDG